MKVFISHSKRNRTRAVKLAERLKIRGVDVWFDEWDVLVGHNLADQIYDGIRSSDLLLVLLTKASIESRWVKEEIDFAKVQELEDGGVKVVPLLYEKVEIPPPLKSKAYADFSSFDRGFDQLMKTIAVPQSELVSYIEMIPDIVADARRKAQSQLDTGVTSEMLSGAYSVVDIMEEVLVHMLSTFYPPEQFPDPSGYLSEVVRSRFDWHHRHSAVDGPGSGGTMMGPIVAMEVAQDLGKMIEDVVSSLTAEDDEFDYRRWRAAWNAAN